MLYSVHSVILFFVIHYNFIRRKLWCFKKGDPLAIAKDELHVSRFTLRKTINFTLFLSTKFQVLLERGKDISEYLDKGFL